MREYIIFDLSEVLIAGLVGVEKMLSQELFAPEDEILPGFLGNLFLAFLTGNISEEMYLEHIISRERWNIAIPRLKELIRVNFHNEVEGSLDILRRLSSRYGLILHSDHGKEWIEYIRSIHPFIKVFKHAFYSFELKGLKHQPGTFETILSLLAIHPQSCLFIDDNPINVAAASSVGIQGVQFRNASQLERELLQMKILLPNGRKEEQS
jgi:FMN phosphatase YigB (HAD superfamily)